MVKYNSHYHVASEHLKCAYAELRCDINVKYIPDFKDSMKKEHISR